MGRMADATTSPTGARAGPEQPIEPGKREPYEPPTLVFVGTLLDLTAGTSDPGPDPT